MRSVEGFLASDGTFFESSIDAELHEASRDLDKAAIETGVLKDKPYRLREAINQLLTNVERYVNASKAKTDALRYIDDNRTSDSGDADDRTREEGTTTVLEQSFGQSE